MTFSAPTGRVRMKSGGADVRILDRMVDNGDGEDWRGSILRNARRIADIATEDEPLSGYLVVGMYKGGTCSIGYRYDPEMCAIPRALWPAWIAEVLRRDIIMGLEARSVFDEMFQWQDGAS